MSPIVVSTFSIVAADPEAGDVGVAVASKFLAVGAVVPWASAGAGAVATQSYANASFGPNGIALMRSGESAEQALQKLLADDPEPEKRQVGLVDARGGSAAHTGSGCFGWAGHRLGPCFACQGNILVGEETVSAMASTFERSRGPLAERLYQALAAGQAGGGDSRGRQSAALYVARENAGYLGFSDVLVDLRVDDAADPIGEMARLLELQNLFFGSSPPEEKLRIEGAVLSELQGMLVAVGSLRSSTGAWDTDTERALELLVGTENLEERVDFRARTIDEPALKYLRAKLSREC
jgi:uncharacterized Ntn-hydrolase superfamily protein